MHFGFVFRFAITIGVSVIRTVQKDSVVVSYDQAPQQWATQRRHHVSIHACTCYTSCHRLVFSS